MNQDVIAMADKLILRLQDIKEVIAEASCELTGYDKRLDRIDDQLYLLMVDIEKMPTTMSDQQKDEVVSNQSVSHAANNTTNYTTNESSSRVSNESKTIPLNVQDQAREFSTNQADAHTQAQIHTASEPDSVARDVSPQGSQASSEKEGFFSEEVKENMKEGARALNGIYNDGKEVVAELSDAMADIRGVFDIKSKFRR